MTPRELIAAIDCWHDVAYETVNTTAHHARALELVDDIHFYLARGKFMPAKEAAKELAELEEANEV